MFVSSICGAGIVHQMVWLGKEPLVRDVSRGWITKETNNRRQLVMALKLYAADHDGAYPGTLELLVDDEILEEISELAFTRDEFGTIIAPVAYYGAGMTDASSGKYVLLASPGPYFRGKKRIVATNDGSVTTYTEERFREMVADRPAEGGVVR